MQSWDDLILAIATIELSASSVVIELFAFWVALAVYCVAATLGGLRGNPKLVLLLSNL